MSGTIEEQKRTGGGGDGDGDGCNESVAEMLAIKLRGDVLTDQQIACMVQKITDGTMDDYQLGAFLAAVMLKGMIREETVSLTKHMRDSGRVMHWPAEWKTVDKHSTGGVGDKVSLPLTPALASLGLHVPMISGRGLEHTGGTLDKLESIPNYTVGLSEDQMRAALLEAGCCIVGQTADLDPADRRMYLARDVTSTVTSLPLIVSSIISKKAAGDMKALVLDVKYGHAAFMKTLDEAKTLAEAMVEVSTGLGIKTVALATKMSNPIGRAIGNAVEVMEALECMRGGGPDDLKELVTHLGGELVVASGLAKTPEEGQKAIAKALGDGSALNSFKKMIVMQGVSVEVANKLCGKETDNSSLPQADNTTSLKAKETGVIMKMDAMALAKVCQQLGAGRESAGDPIDLAVGMILRKTVGQKVTAGEAWVDVLHNKPKVLTESMIKAIQESITVDKNAKEFPTPSRIGGRFA